MRYRVTQTQARMVARISRMSGHPRSDRWPSAVRGQVVAEYFILFAVVAMLTLVGFTAFDDDIKRSLEGFLDAAAAKIAQ